MTIEKKIVKTVKTVNIVTIEKKIVKKIVKNKTPDLGNNQSHLNHCFLKRLLIETFCNRTYTISEIFSLKFFLIVLLILSM